MMKRNVVRLSKLLIGAALVAGPAAAPARAALMGKPAESSVQKQGAQQPRRNTLAPVDKSKKVVQSHLQIVLQLSADGRAEVIKATELPGPAVLSDAPVGDYLYEVTKAGKRIAAESLIDPFEMRSFPPPGDGDIETLGHHSERAGTARLVVKVPATRLKEGRLDRLSIRLLKVVGGRPEESITSESVARLQQSGKLEPRWEASGAQLASALQAKGRVVR